MGNLTLWTSVVGFRNLSNNKQFYAYSEKTNMNCLQISVPISAVCTFKQSPFDDDEGFEFLCFEKELWLQG